jgi:hypothetical protein
LLKVALNTINKPQSTINFLYFKVHWYRNIFIAIFSFSDQVIIEKSKQWWSAISPISTKQTVIPHLKSLNIKMSRYVLTHFNDVLMNTSILKTISAYHH